MPSSHYVPRPIRSSQGMFPLFPGSQLHLYCALGRGLFVRRPTEDSEHCTRDRLAADLPTAAYARCGRGDGWVWRTSPDDRARRGWCWRPDFDGVRQSSQQALADLSCSPTRSLAPGCHDCRFYLFRQLVGTAEGAAGPITQPFQTAFFIPLKDLIAGFPRNAGLPAQ
jgi:hypothetical protein